jgi:hypothetical protein
MMITITCPKVRFSAGGMGFGESMRVIVSFEAWKAPKLFKSAKTCMK